MSGAIKVLDIQAYLAKMVQRHVLGGGDARDLEIQIQELDTRIHNRAIPPRPKQPEPVSCNTCLDHKVVTRIRAGWNHGELCPDCNGGSW